MTTVLVTGATGFVGAAIVRQFTAAGLDIRTTARSSVPRNPLPCYVCADLRDVSILPNLLTGVDAVVHAAGMAHQFGRSCNNAAQFTAHNIQTTENLVRRAIAQGVRHFVLISSVSVYGLHKDEMCTENHSCRPFGAYAESKLVAEQRAIRLARDCRLNLTILRLATVYGEEDPGNVARLMRTIDRGRFVWVGKGSNLKSLIHRDDVARACIAVLRQRPQGINVFNLSGPPCSMREIVETLATSLGRGLPRWHIPASVALAVAGVPAALAGRIGFLKRPYVALRKWLADDAYDASKFNRTFSFQTQIPIYAGLGREAMWYRSLIPERRL